MAPKQSQRPVRRSRRQARGMMLIEALIAILIFSIGILGIVGLQATAVQQSTDAKNRAEAAYLADQLMGQMWASTRNPDTLQGSFDSDFCGSAGCPSYATWAATVQSVLPGVSLTSGADTRPSVDVQPSTATQPGLITISIFWRAPQDDASVTTTRHRYDLQAWIGQQ